MINVQMCAFILYRLAVDGVDFTGERRKFVEKERRKKILIRFKYTFLLKLPLLDSDDKYTIIRQ